MPGLIQRNPGRNTSKNDVFGVRGWVCPKEVKLVRCLLELGLKPRRHKVLSKMIEEEIYECNKLNPAE